MAIDLHTKLCDMMGIEYPIMAFCHCRDVVAAVCNAGGSGCLGVSGFSPEQIAIEGNWLKTHTDKPFGLDVLTPQRNPATATREQLLTMVPQEYKDFVDGIKKELGLPEEAEMPQGGVNLGAGGTLESQWATVNAMIEAKPAYLCCALGVSREIVEKAHAAGIKVFSLTGNVKNAVRNAETGADVIIAAGTEAGGHTGRIGTLALVPQVVDAVSPTPVLAAGGIMDGRGLVAALALGAVGVWTGTIWQTAHEYPLPDWIKEQLLNATDEDAVVSKVYTGKTARFLKNKYIEAWNQPGAPKTLPAPFQNLYSPMPLWVTTDRPEALSQFEKPQVREWVSTAAGSAVGLIKELKSARQITYDMMSQAIDVLGV